MVRNLIARNVELCHVDVVRVSERREEGHFHGAAIRVPPVSEELVHRVDGVWLDGIISAAGCVSKDSSVYDAAVSRRRACRCSHEPGSVARSCEVTRSSRNPNDTCVDRNSDGSVTIQSTHPHSCRPRIRVHPGASTRRPLSLADDRRKHETHAVNSTNIGVSAYSSESVQPIRRSDASGHTGLRPPGGDVLAQAQLGSLHLLGSQEYV